MGNRMRCISQASEPFSFLSEQQSPAKILHLCLPGSSWEVLCEGDCSKGCSPGSCASWLLHDGEETTIPIVLPHTGTLLTSDAAWLGLVVKRGEQKCKLGVSFASGAGALGSVKSLPAGGRFHLLRRCLIPEENLR